RDSGRDVRFVQYGDWETNSELCVPIITRHGIWGVLDQQTQRPGAYAPRLVQVAEIVAQQLAIAVENTALIGQARDQAQLLEQQTRELTQVLALNSQLRVGMAQDELLQHLADTAVAAAGFQTVVVNLVDEAANRAWVSTTSGCTPADQEILRGAS